MICKGKRKLGRPRSREKGNFKMDFKGVGLT
jgi:hypothetical protein